MAQWPVLGSAVPTRSNPYVALAPAQTFVLGPGAAVYMIQLDSAGYLALQQRNLVTGQWVGVAFASVAVNELVYSDGVNYRIANITGCPQSTSAITAGSGYTSAPTITPSAGGSIWKAIIGGAVSSTFTIAAAGSNYTYPPIVLIDPPPFPGVAATAYATISGGAVTAITLVAAGAGYLTPPNVTLLNDPREISPISSTITTGYGAVVTSALTGAGTVTGIALLDQGASVGSTPTLAFSGGGGSSAAATVTAITAAAAATAYIQQM